MYPWQNTMIKESKNISAGENLKLNYQACHNDPSKTDEESQDEENASMHLRTVTAITNHDGNQNVAPHKTRMYQVLNAYNLVRCVQRFEIMYSFCTIQSIISKNEDILTFILYKSHLADIVEFVKDKWKLLKTHSKNYDAIKDRPTSSYNAINDRQTNIAAAASSTNIQKHYPSGEFRHQMFF